MYKDTYALLPIVTLLFFFFSLQPLGGMYDAFHGFSLLMMILLLLDRGPPEKAITKNEPSKEITTDNPNGQTTFPCCGGAGTRPCRLRLSSYNTPLLRLSTESQRYLLVDHAFLFFIRALHEFPAYTIYTN